MDRLKVLYDKIKSEKLTHDVGEAFTKFSALKSGDIDYSLLWENSGKGI